MMTTAWPWLTLALLGAYHGINPAMGWLFAVALGLQERRRAGVLRAIPPIALGHAGAVALAVVLLLIMQSLIPSEAVRYAGAGALIGVGVGKLLRRGAHPRWVGMQVGFRDLATWSFLMATAHGAGLMLVPVLLPLSRAAAAPAHAHGAHAGHLPPAGPPLGLPGEGLVAVGLHSLAMFLVMAVIALLVYEKLGLTILRRAWINLDLIWAAALVASGVVTLIL